MARTNPAASGPRLNLPIFLLALLGVLVVVHLWVQAQAGFAYGCTGAGDAASGAGCAAVTSSAYSEFLGVSLLVWGGLFYVAVAALRLGVAATRPPTSETLRKVSLGVVTAGFLFALYLVSVQVFALAQFCVLCLASSLTTATLFALHLVERAKGPGPAVAVSAALRPYALGLAALVVLAGADVLLAGDGAEAAAAIPAGEVLTTAETADCHYDFETPRLANFDELITMETPYEGNPDAPVRVLKIFDPNCPHCKTLHTALEGIVPQLGDEARFYYQPYPIWDYSVPQVQALYLAAEEDKFFEMLDLQFLAQQHGGLSLDQVADAARRIGMDPERVRREIEARKYVGLITEEKEMIAAAGVRSVPKLVIEGRVLAYTDRAWTAECIGRLVEQAAAEKRQAAEAAAASDL